MLVNALILVTVFLALLAGHFFPWYVLRWRVLVDDRGNLNRVPAYVYGTSCIVIGFWVWTLANEAEPDAVRALILIVVAAGLGTVAPRGVRWLIEKQAQLDDAKDGVHGPSKRG